MSGRNTNIPTYFRPVFRFGGYQLFSTEGRNDGSGEGQKDGPKRFRGTSAYPPDPRRRLRKTQDEEMDRGQIHWEALNATRGINDSTSEYTHGDTSRTIAPSTSSSSWIEEQISSSRFTLGGGTALLSLALLLGAFWFRRSCCSKRMTHEERIALFSQVAPEPTKKLAWSSATIHDVSNTSLTVAQSTLTLAQSMAESTHGLTATQEHVEEPEDLFQSHPPPPPPTMTPLPRLPPRQRTEQQKRKRAQSESSASSSSNSLSPPSLVDEVEAVLQDLEDDGGADDGNVEEADDGDVEGKDEGDDEAGDEDSGDNDFSSTAEKEDDYDDDEDDVFGIASIATTVTSTTATVKDSRDETVSYASSDMLPRRDSGGWSVLTQKVLVVPDTPVYKTKIEEVEYDDADAQHRT